MTGGAILRGLVVPFGILLLAFFVLFFAGMNGSLGPLDLATASWIVIALWVIAPVVGGLLGRTLSARDLVRAASWLGLVLGAAVAFFFLTAAGTAAASCAVAVGTNAVGYVLGCLAVGTVAGGGMSASLLLTARLARRESLVAAVIVGGALNLLAGAGAYFLFYSIIKCFR